MSQVPPPPLNNEIPDQIRGLARTLMSFFAWSELSPRHQLDVLQWNGPPTPLATRQISGPGDDAGGRYAALLIALYRSRRAAELAAGARVIEGKPVHRSIVELEASSLEVIDARALEGLTDRALLDKDPRAWRLLRIIRDHFGAGAIWISRQHARADAVGNSASAGATVPGADMIVLFSDAIDRTMFVRDEALYKVLGNGEASLLRPVDTPEPQREPRGHKLVWNVRRVIAHIIVALVAALAAHPAVELAGELLGVNVVVPAVIPALVGLGIGAVLARPVVRRLRAGRKVMAHVLELPATHALFMERLDELQRGGMEHGARPAGNVRPMIVDSGNVDVNTVKSGNADEVRPPGISAPTSNGFGHVDVIAEWHAHAGANEPAVSRVWALGVRLSIALLVALLAHPVVELAGDLVGVNIVVPAVIPALVGLGIGAAVAVVITRRLRRYGEVIGHVLQLPNNQARLINRLDALQRNDDHPGSH